MSAHVFDTMGTTASLRFPGPLPDSFVLRAVEDAFDAFDRRFSLYRPDSEISWIARGELTLSRSSRAVRDCYADALEWGRRTHGAFTPLRPDGVLDLSGLVKAQAISTAGGMLAAAGQSHWILNVGGDILVAGSFDGAPWRLGIVDPADRDALVCTVEMTRSRRALATSGTAERGEHVWRLPASTGTYRQVSVLAEDIVTADALATAILAGGPTLCDDVLDRFDVDVLTVDQGGALTASRRLRDAYAAGSA